jgi:polar amino acid transport system substrate-binding protein
VAAIEPSVWDAPGRSGRRRVGADDGWISSFRQKGEKMSRFRPWPLITLIVLSTIAVVAAGCGGDNDNKESSTGNVKKTLTVGSDIPYTPFEFGKPPYKGLDVDVVNAIAKGLGSTANFKKTPFDTIFRDLAQGKFDMVASATTITPERKKEVDFSNSYFPADQSLMVKQGSDIKTVDDVAGKVIGAQLGTTGAEYAKNETKASSVRTYDLIDDAFNALEAGQIEAVINDCPVSVYAQRAHKNLVVVAAIQTNEQYGLAFPKGSDTLRNAVNEELAKLVESGELKKISVKWLGTRPCALHGESTGGSSSG